MSHRKEHITDSALDFRLLFESLPGSFVVVLSDAPDYTVVAASDSYLRDVKKTRDQLLGQSAFSAFAGSWAVASIDALRASFERVLTAHTADTVTVERRRVEQTQTQWIALSSPVLGQAGEVQFIINRVDNVAEVAPLKQAQAEEHLRAISDGTYEYIGLLTPDGTVLDANPASLEFIQDSRESVIGRKIWDAPWFTTTPGASEAVRAGVLTAAGGEFVRYETTLRRPSGGESTFDFSRHPVRNERGEVVLLVPEGRDITALKSLELRNSFLVKLDDATRALTDPHEIARTAARLLCEHLQASRCAYSRVQEDADSFHVLGGHRAGLPAILVRQQPEPLSTFPGPWAACRGDGPPAIPIPASVPAWRLCIRTSAGCTRKYCRRGASSKLSGESSPPRYGIAVRSPQLACAR